MKPNPETESANSKARTKSTTTTTNKYVVIFTSHLNEATSDYESMAEKMIELAKKQPGFLSVDSARGNDLKGITVSYWDSLEAIHHWKQNVQHLGAQKLGKEKWYKNYSISIAKVERKYP